MEETDLTKVTQNSTCLVHHVRPLIGINNDLITVRCCCDLLTDKFISFIDNKLKGQSVSDLIDTWEKDLLVNELKAE